MVLVNETFSVDINHSDDWIKWIQEQYIPALVESKLLENCILSRVQNSQIQGAESFALQFVVTNESKLTIWKENLDPELKQKLNAKFAGRYASFQTFLNIISNH